MEEHATLTYKAMGIEHTTLLLKTEILYIHHLVSPALL